MYIAIFQSNPGTQKLRDENRPAHDAYWEEHIHRLRVAGPILTDDGQGRLGQMLLIDAPDKATAEKIVTEDPFVKVGLFASWSIQRYRVSVENGKTL